MGNVSQSNFTAIRGGDNHNIGNFTDASALLCEANQDIIITCFKGSRWHVNALGRDYSLDFRDGDAKTHHLVKGNFNEKFVV